MGYLKTKQPFFFLLCFALRCATCLEQILPGMVVVQRCDDDVRRFTTKTTGSPSSGIFCQTAVLYFQR